MDLEAELDKLYQAPASAFVAKRNEIAQELRESGERERAEHVARLQRPSPVAWAVNLLHFRDPKLLRDLRKAGIALRKAQESGDTERFDSRKRAHQEALFAATERAVELAEASGLGTAANSKRRIEMTLTVLSTAAEDVNPPPGRMRVELEPLGFDAFTDVPVAPPPKPPKRAAPEDAGRTAKIDAVKQALGAADKELRRLEREAERSQAALERAERDLEDAERRAEAAKQARRDAERETTAAKARVDDATREVEKARRALDEIEQ